MYANMDGGPLSYLSIQRQSNSVNVIREMDVKDIVSHYCLNNKSLHK